MICVCGCGTAGAKIGLGKGCFDLDGRVVVVHEEVRNLGQDEGGVAHRYWTIFDVLQVIRFKYIWGLSRSEVDGNKGKEKEKRRKRKISNDRRALQIK